MNRSTRIYVDTSVFGGVHDEEFASPSKVFFDEVCAGFFIDIRSPLEVIHAPDDEEI